ncbi:XRE family transcriptional regulator [Listeria seeligeri]|uniref:helix-turn-helix domain-containing protein n=1 Tax=Listeria seeligeri TaxID=1640 RepID=UPI0019448A51|nr:helix-turn-helix transcriptional regulator [Listeria seeligeri]MBM5604538.1 XRE family transcriptional regulator [Listeria seeligeri]
MSVGSRIRRVRKFRDMTQKELGIALGYDEKSADVRITQYETGTRTPKIDVLNAMAEVLNVNVLSLKEPTLYSAEDILSILFEIDEETNVNLFDIEDNNDSSNSDTNIGVVINYRILQDFLKEWKLRKQELNDGIITKSEYTEWKINWPYTADDCGKIEPKIQWKNNK